ncbi:uncharacterized protein [Narcine bancroftii]|uniref:uncharacterized protein n=1 Tax=Narcine bancroftii TaxID=1343680 RepID=UPI0038320E85
MAHTLSAVLRLAGIVWILIPGASLMKETNKCQTDIDADIYTKLKSSLMTLINCSKNVTESLEAEEHSELYKMLQTATDKLRSIRMKACQNVNPKICSFPIVPANGGLICLTLNKTRYCKPMCNKGYDFQFIRRSRGPESCGKETEYKWRTQYISGDRLAVCTASSIAVSAEPSYYFPKRCQDVLDDYKQETLLIADFEKELREKGHGKVNNRTMCLVCGV